MESAAADRPGSDNELVQAVGMLIAASVRLDPDPADKIGLMLSQLVRNASHEGSRIVAVVFLRELCGILDDAKTGWAAEGWPTPEETMQWIVDVVRTGVDNIEAGADPWTQGEPAPTPALEAVPSPTTAETAG